MSYHRLKRLKHTWTMYISGNDDPHRPTENAALKNLRYDTKVEDWTIFIKQFEDMYGSYKQNMASQTERDRQIISCFHVVPKPTAPALTPICT